MTDPRKPSTSPITRDDVLAHVCSALTTLMASRGGDTAITAETRLLGADAALDSLGLVTLIVDLEDRLRDAYGRDVSLTHERALSRSRSPYSSVSALADYATERLHSPDEAFDQ